MNVCEKTAANGVLPDQHDQQTNTEQKVPSRAAIAGWPPGALLVGSKNVLVVLVASFLSLAGPTNTDQQKTTPTNTIEPRSQLL